MFSFGVEVFIRRLFQVAKQAYHSKREIMIEGIFVLTPSWVLGKCK